MLGIEYMLNRSGPLSMAPSQFGIFAHSGIKNHHGTNQETIPSKDLQDGECVLKANESDSLKPSTPDLQFHVQPLSLDDLSIPDSLHKYKPKHTSITLTSNLGMCHDSILLSLCFFHINN
jgi:hypothetical protein